MAKFTALNKIAERSSLASKAAQRSRCGGRPEAAERYEGAAFAYSEAHREMKREIERLRNLFQNGALSMDEFDTSDFVPAHAEA